MSSLATLAQALGIAYASGLSPYATVALVGLAERLGWVGPVPGVIGAFSHPAVIGLAGAIAVVEFLATLVPGIASAWDAVHTLVRPPSAVLLAVATAWHAEPVVVVVAALLGGGLGLATHATKLGLRVVVDTSPEPVTNALMNTTELGVIAALSYFLWHHPVLALSAALALLVLTVVLVRAVWRLARRVLGNLVRGRGVAAGPR